MFNIYFIFLLFFIFYILGVGPSKINVHLLVSSNPNAGVTFVCTCVFIYTKLLRDHKHITFTNGSILNKIMQL